MKKGKIWGETTVLLSTPFIEVHRLQIKPNAFCSLHKHNFKWNGFYVISGKLMIESHKNDYKLVDQTIINAGEFASFPPGEQHKFMSFGEPVECLEIYYPEPLSEDIVRSTVGGMVNETK